ncbi:MAG: hypothetical protein ABW123_23510 [Cystobacter sp.]
MALIQEKWQEELCLMTNGVLYSTGELILMECALLTQDGKTHVRARPLARSTLDSVLEFNENPWTFVTELASCSSEEGNLRLSCGEGGMGADGYVAAIRTPDEQIEWIAFFDCSNPFCSVKISDGNAVAVSTHGHVWTFPINRPELLTVRP